MSNTRILSNPSCAMKSRTANSQIHFCFEHQFQKISKSVQITYFKALKLHWVEHSIKTRDWHDGIMKRENAQKHKYV